MSHTARNQPSPVVVPRFALMMISVLLAVVAWPTPARAEGDDCAMAVERLAAWGDRERGGGLTPQMLDDLHDMTRVIDTCFRLRPSSSDDHWDDSLVSDGPDTDPDKWRPLAAVYFEPGDVERAVCLMGRESGGNPQAVNRSTGAAGLMQVMPFWAGHYGYSIDDLANPSINLWIARQILDRQGWYAWSPYLRGSCH